MERNQAQEEASMLVCPERVRVCFSPCRPFPAPLFPPAHTFAQLSQSTFASTLPLERYCHFQNLVGKRLWTHFTEKETEIQRRKGHL